MIKNTSCFAAGTPLLVPDGSKFIEDIRVGDLVLSRDEDDPEGPFVAKRVANLFQNYSPLLDLHLGGSVIRTTPEHPFWVIGRGWVAAQQIEVGESLLGAVGERTVVESIEGPSEPGAVYNLAIEEYHTYLVGAALWGFSVWVHNADYPDAPSSHSIPPKVYRGGSATPDNLTPRPGVDTTGLSTFDNLEAATPPGGKAQVIDTSKLQPPLMATPDAPPPGHVSIGPQDPASIAEWAATRGTGQIHPLTQAIMDAIVDVVKRPK